MGCASSRKFEPNPRIEGQDAGVLEVAQNLGISKEDVDMLYTAFIAIDADNSGNIRPSELFQYFNVESSVFEAQVFELADDDNSGDLNFLEFVVSMWNLLTLPETSLGSVLYLMKDPTGALRIRYNDVKDLLESMHKRKLETSTSLSALFDQLKRDFDIEISLLEFCKWIAANPSLITPLLMLQIKLRKTIIGESYWTRLAAERKQHATMGKLDFTKKAFDKVREKNNSFRARRKQEEIDLRRQTKLESDSSKSSVIQKRKEGGGAQLLGPANPLAQRPTSPHKQMLPPISRSNSNGTGVLGGNSGKSSKIVPGLAGDISGMGASSRKLSTGSSDENTRIRSSSREKPLPSPGSAGGGGGGWGSPAGGGAGGLGSAGQRKSKSGKDFTGSGEQLLGSGVGGGQGTPTGSPGTPTGKGSNKGALARGKSERSASGSGKKKK